MFLRQVKKMYPDRANDQEFIQRMANEAMGITDPKDIYKDK